MCSGSSNNLSLCWGLHGATRSLMVNKGSVSYIVPGYTYDTEAWYVWPDTCLFSLQTANTKCIGSDLPVKWAVPKLAFFSCGCTLLGLF